MSSLKIISMLLVVYLVSLGCANRNQTIKFDRYYFAVLDAQVESERAHEYHTMDRIYDLNQKSKNPEPLLIDLLDYYLGEAGNITLAEFITQRGKKMLPLLVRKRTQPLECLPKYRSICIDSIKIRNQVIDRVTDAINKGIVIRAEDPSVK